MCYSAKQNVNKETHTWTSRCASCLPMQQQMPAQIKPLNPAPRSLVAQAKAPTKSARSNTTHPTTHPYSLNISIHSPLARRLPLSLPFAPSDRPLKKSMLARGMSDDSRIPSSGPPARALILSVAGALYIWARSAAVRPELCCISFCVASRTTAPSSGSRALMPLKVSESTITYGNSSNSGHSSGTTKSAVWWQQRQGHSEGPGCSKRTLRPSVKNCPKGQGRHTDFKAHSWR